MATIHNPTPYRLSCRLAVVIEPGESIEVSDDDLDGLEGTVLEITRSKAKPRSETDAETEPSSTPTRRTRKRGAASAETTEAPRRETR